MRPSTHSLGKNGNGNTVFAKTLSNGDLQMICIGTATRTELNLSAEQVQLLKGVLA